MVSKTGYRDDSPDKNNPYNIIPSNKISMKGVSIPLIGVPIKGGAPSLEEARLMKPGEEHNFEGAEAVIEIPIPKGAKEDEIMAYVQSVIDEIMKSTPTKKNGGMVRTFRRSSKFQGGGWFKSLFNSKNTNSELDDWMKGLSGSNKINPAFRVTAIGSGIGQVATAIQGENIRKEQKKLYDVMDMQNAAGDNRIKLSAGYAQYPIAKCGGKLGSRVVKKKAGGEVAAAIFNSVSSISPFVPPPFGPILAGIGIGGNIINSFIQGEKLRDKIKKEAERVRYRTGLYLNTGNQSGYYS